VSEQTAVAMREGDIFRWRYKPERSEQIKRYSHDPYWAKSCIAVVHDGRLVDTFWGGYGSDAASWDAWEAARDLDLTYVGNFDELTRVDEWKREYYADKDCVCLNHSNSPKGNFYIRKGAKRNAAKMRETAEYKLQRAKDAMESARRDIERFEAILDRIDGGADLEDIYL
jgi:hypothetical protein